MVGLSIFSCHSCQGSEYVYFWHHCLSGQYEAVCSFLCSHIARTHFPPWQDWFPPNTWPLNLKLTVEAACVWTTGSDREGRMITMVWHTGGRKQVRGIGGMREGKTECQSWLVATSVCNQHLYPSSLATAKRCECLSHLFVRPLNAQSLS